MPPREIRRLIKDNFPRFKESIDFIDLKAVGDTHTLEELGYSKQSVTQAEHIYLLSERGYGKLIKIMDTDLAWDIYEQLLDEYFTLRDEKNLPGTYLDALKALVAAEEEKEKLIAERKKDAVKIEFFNAVAGSKDAIDMGKVAKILNFEGVGRNRMFEILRNAEILDRFNIPYQRYINDKFFRLIESPYLVNGEKRVSTKTLVQQKGILLIKRTLCGLGYHMVPNGENEQYL